MGVFRSAFVSKAVAAIMLPLMLVSLLALPGVVPRAFAQPLTLSAIQVDPGNTKLTGQTFGYRLTYTCESSSGPCLNAEVVFLLPAEVQYASTVPASPTGDVAAIQVTPNFSGTGRTRVRFQMISPLPAGNSGDLIVNARFPNGSTPDATTATATADAINLGATPGTTTTPTVTVTAVAEAKVDLTVTLQPPPANLDLPETLRLRVAVPNEDGTLNVTSVGPVTYTMPPGTVFNGATPAADCQPGCVGTTPATVTWTSPCTVPLTPNSNCDISVNVTFPSATFPSGTNVSHSFTADATPLADASQTFGPGTLSHPVTTFVPSPGAGFSKNMASNTPNPPTLNQTFSYDLNVSNNGNVPLDNLVIIDTLPVEFQAISVTTGAYTGLAAFAAGEGVRVSYEKNTALGVFTLWGSSPNSSTNTTLTAPPPGLGAGEYITRIRWEFGQAAPGMAASTRPLITGRIINPDNAGGPVAIADSIQNCAALSAVYTAGPTDVNRNDCESFSLSGPFVQLNPAKENLSGGGPFNPGQAIEWRMRVRSDSRSSDSVPLESLVVTDLLPVNLTWASWTYDDQGSGLPAPQVFAQIPNYAGTGRTLLRWQWNAGSGNLGVNQQVLINTTTTVRSGAIAGTLSNDVTIDSDASNLTVRCSTSTQTDVLDLDGDGDTAETLCRATGSVTVASIAQVSATKTITNVCGTDTNTTATAISAGCMVEFTLAMQNVATVPMQNLTLIDILPGVGDTNVRDGAPRGSAWPAHLAAPITAPSGVTVYYSTAQNPCRGEVGGPTTGCDAANWTTAAPTPISSVRAIKIVFNTVFQPFDTASFSYAVTTPLDAPPASTAYNSFAYSAERADGLGTVSGEPQKVSLTPGAPAKASIGDRVWLDTNANGLQDDGEVGLNDVEVRLLSTGSDGIAGTADDVLLSRTLTANGLLGQPGVYEFSGLDAGSYVVCVEAPLTYTLTAPNAADASANSDMSLATGCSSAITLDTADTRTDIDAGLVATGDAAVTGYVWFDHDGDGMQDEAVYDGANGQRVELYAFGDAGQTVIAATHTADDAFGRPGYYHFENVPTGLEVYVQFQSQNFTVPNAGDDRTDSDVGASGSSIPTMLAPGEVARWDAGLVPLTGTLALGDQIWIDNDSDGIYEPQNGEFGIDGVRVDLYRDANGNDAPNSGEHVASTLSGTSSGFAGRYQFSNLAPGVYIVVVPASNFASGGALDGMISPENGGIDPDDDADGDDNGFYLLRFVRSAPVTLTDNGEPTTEDGNNDTNLTVDFGFVAGTNLTGFDLGDAPDAGAGSGSLNYQTTVLDDGPLHYITSLSPYLGNCVDGDDGAQANQAADADDRNTGSPTRGVCDADDAGDEDGVAIPDVIRPGETAIFTIAATADCTLSAWIDWNRNGEFGDIPSETLTVTDFEITAIKSLGAGVPADTPPGPTYARFRCSDTGPVAPTGDGGPGEVEDYFIYVVIDDTAPTTTATAVAGASAYTFGSWTNQNVVVTLTADDGDGSGAAATYYSVDSDACMTTALASCSTYTTPFTISAEGQHTVRYFSVDTAGNAESVKTVQVNIDRTAPTLNLPANIVMVNGTATGANVTYTVTATDNFDSTPTVVCNPPSGSRFPVGIRTVTCTATDDAGNTSNGSFTVTVRNVGASLLALQRQIEATRTGRNQKLSMVFITYGTQAAISANNVQAACGSLNLLQGYIGTQVNMRTITAADATKLYAKINAVRTSLGCGSP